MLLSSEAILQELAVYKGAGKEIREAISTPNEECQRKAWISVVPLVTKLKRFYDFSKELGKGDLLKIVFIQTRASFSYLYWLLTILKISGEEES